MAIHACNSSIQEGQRGGSHVQGYPQVKGEFWGIQNDKRACLKINKQTSYKPEPFHNYKEQRNEGAEIRKLSTTLEYFIFSFVTSRFVLEGGSTLLVQQTVLVIQGLDF